MSYGTEQLNEWRGMVSLVGLIEADTGATLRPSDDKWRGLCPFHDGDDPSFMVSPAHRVFHCFGCGVGGDVYGWLMRYRGLSFPEAVETARGVAESRGE